MTHRSPGVIGAAPALIVSHSGYKPWRGSEFGGGPLGTKRLLLLGESHYSAEAECDTPDLTISVVEQVKAKTQVIPFFNRAADLVTTSARIGHLDRSNFWDAVTFYNYIPCLVGTAARVRPTRAMWDAAPAPFGATLTDIEPERVLVLGKTLWNHIKLPSGWTSEVLGDERNALRTWTTPAGRSIRATWINHPSSVGFSLAKWHPRAEALLA